MIDSFEGIAAELVPILRDSQIKNHFNERNPGICGSFTRQHATDLFHNSF